jgi:hypothetical protein
MAPAAPPPSCPLRTVQCIRMHIGAALSAMCSAAFAWQPAEHPSTPSTYATYSFVPNYVLAELPVWHALLPPMQGLCAPLPLSAPPPPPPGPRQLSVLTCCPSSLSHSLACCHGCRAGYICLTAEPAGTPRTDSAYRAATSLSLVNCSVAGTNVSRGSFLTLLACLPACCAGCLRLTAEPAGTP